MPADLMVDLSSNNPVPDLQALWDKGYRALGLKATESTTYTWSEGQVLADKWHAKGAEATVWFYHFARPGSGKAQAEYFLNAVKGHLRPQDRLVCDAEVSGVTDALVDEFFTYVHANRPNKEEIYSYGSFLEGAHIRPHHEEGLWLADYSAGSPAVPPGWKAWDAWQFSQTSKVPGETREVDESHLAKDSIPSKPKPAPKPKPKPKPAPKKPAPKNRWWHWFSWGRKNY